MIMVSRCSFPRVSAHTLVTNAHLWKTLQEAEHTTASNVNIPMKYFFPSKFPLDLLQIKKGGGGEVH